MTWAIKSSCRQRFHCRHCAKASILFRNFHTTDSVAFWACFTDQLEAASKWPTGRLKTDLKKGIQGVVNWRRWVKRSALPVWFARDCLETSKFGRRWRQPLSLGDRMTVAKAQLFRRQGFNFPFLGQDLTRYKDMSISHKLQHSYGYRHCLECHWQLEAFQTMVQGHIEWCRWFSTLLRSHNHPTLLSAEQSKSMATKIPDCPHQDNDIGYYRTIHGICSWLANWTYVFNLSDSLRERLKIQHSTYLCERYVF